MRTLWMNPRKFGDVFTDINWNNLKLAEDISAITAFKNEAYVPSYLDNYYVIGKKMCQ